MEEEKKIEETKVEPSKKKNGVLKLLYWLVVIGGCVFIFLGSYKIGYKLGNYFGDKESSNTTTKKDNKESNSNVESNSNEESNSNITSNTTECVEEEKTEEITYSTRDFVGSFVSKEASLSYSFSTQATYGTDLYGVPGCGGGTLGNFYVEGNKIYLYPLIGTGCDTNWQVLNTKGKVATIVSKDEIQIDGKTYKRENNTSLNESDGGLRYGLKVLKEYIPESN